MAQVKGEGVRDLKLLAAKLRVADPKLKREVRKALRGQADPLVRKVRRSVMGWTAYHDHDYSLREALARTVYAQVSYSRTGVKIDIVSAGSRMPPGMGNLNGLTDRAEGWSHPVYAQGPRFSLAPSRARRYARRTDRERPLVKRGAWTWVRQEGKPGWFEKPVYTSHGEIKRALEDALDDVARFVAG